MSFDPRTPSGNQLLDAMPSDVVQAIAGDLDWIAFDLREAVFEPGQNMRHALFPVSGIFSAIALADLEEQAEMGLIGQEGFVGAPILLGAEHSPLRIIVQGPGRALQMKAARLMQAAADMPEFRAVLLRFVHVFLVQAASTVLANSSYLVEERLARWILMSQDRMQSASFPMTHEFLALMLAVRRAGVTESIHRLESRELIRASRGQMQVLDRAGLEALAGGCYGQAEREHKRLISPAQRG